MFRHAALILSVSLCTATFSRAAEPPSQPPPKVKPSFDCATAKSTNAKSKWKLLVCGDDTLAALDMQEDTLLRRARAKAVTPDAVNAEQDLWISARDGCASPGCLTAAYRRRIRELHNWTN